jgi:hypothetical protein
MSDTKIRRAPIEGLELQIRIPCAGRTSSEALEELHRGLTEAAAAGRDPLVVLEDLGRLQDSVVAFIKGLSRMLVGYPRSVTFWESSGLTEAFLSAMDRPAPEDR